MPALVVVFWLGALQALGFMHENVYTIQSIYTILPPLLQEEVDRTYKDKAKWTKMSIMSTAGSGMFSSDRTISEYAKDIWHTEPCTVFES